MTDKVIELYNKDDVVATCPECSSTEWELKLNGVGQDWGAIEGSRCSNCGFFVDWIIVNKFDDDSSKAICSLCKGSGVMPEYHDVEEYYKEETEDGG